MERSQAGLGGTCGRKQLADATQPGIGSVRMTIASLPDSVEHDLQCAKKLEWYTLFWLTLIDIAMTWAAGGSQAFKTAWIENVLSLIAPALFLITRRVQRFGEQPGFPFGFQRIGTLAFFLSAVALCAIGELLIAEGLHALCTATHPTVSCRQFFWSGDLAGMDYARRADLQCDTAGDAWPQETGYCTSAA